MRTECDAFYQYNDAIMISLGTIDSDVSSTAVTEYLNGLRKLSGEPWVKLRGEKDDEWIVPQAPPSAPAGTLKVRDLQQCLKDAGFMPFGKVDGICGYRTRAAIRLFQEYLRVVDQVSDIGFPDGKCGPKTSAHLVKWKTAGRKADWVANPTAEYKDWMTLLENVKAHYLAVPSGILKKVNAFAKPTDTVKVADWDFDPGKTHLIGIRRTPAGSTAPAEQQFDDVFVLLVQGMVFKFFGSTDPGAKSKDVTAYPFLVPGQHSFRFGWHKLSDAAQVYHALKPLSTITATPSGVLVVRSADLLLTDKDFEGALEANTTINIHWGGIGGPKVGGWSHGCQVIVGRSYINHHDQVVNCSKFAALTYADLGKTNAQGVYQTRGAYSVLEDLVTALSGSDNVVRYMLLSERDLDVNAEAILNRLKL